MLVYFNFKFITWVRCNFCFYVFIHLNQKLKTRPINALKLLGLRGKMRFYGFLVCSVKIFLAQFENHVFGFLIHSKHNFQCLLIFTSCSYIFCVTSLNFLFHPAVLLFLNCCYFVCVLYWILCCRCHFFCVIKLL